tara:strand:- start:255 stop:476 length:222 start_codon:yes stop_codon:yes gene_type:complete
MAILTEIDSKPLFSKLREALDYGKKQGIEGYHLHKYNIGPNRYRTGYMAGETHEHISNRNLPSTASRSSGGGY